MRLYSNTRPPRQRDVYLTSCLHTDEKRKTSRGTVQLHSHLATNICIEPHAYTHMKNERRHRALFCYSPTLPQISVLTVMPTYTWKNERSHRGTVPLHSHLDTSVCIDRHTHTHMKNGYMLNGSVQLPSKLDKSMWNEHSACIHMTKELSDGVLFSYLLTWTRSSKINVLTAPMRPMNCPSGLFSFISQCAYQHVKWASCLHSYGRWMTLPGSVQFTSNMDTIARGVSVVSVLVWRRNRPGMAVFIYTPIYRETPVLNVVPVPKWKMNGITRLCSVTFWRWRKCLEWKSGLCTHITSGWDYSALFSDILTLTRVPRMEIMPAPMSQMNRPRMALFRYTSISTRNHP